MLVTGVNPAKAGTEYIAEAVRLARKYFNNINGILIVAGACQSDYVNLIKSGSNFASSPKRINIHCMDPAIIASILSLSDSYEKIDIKKILSLTTYDSDGFGGIITNGKLIKGFPRKETNWILT